MSTSIAAPPTKPDAQPSVRRPSRLILLIVLAVGVLVCAFAFGMIRWWPFGKASVLQNLREASDSQVQVHSFRETYFPSPGCILEGVVFIHGQADSKPLITVEKLTIRGSYSGLLAQHISQIRAEGLRVLIPSFGTGAAFHTSQSKITVDEMIADGSAIEFALHDPGKEPLRFDVHQALLKNIGWSGPLSYEVSVHNPEPPGEVTAEGKFGVWNQNDAGETPISGNYKFARADLSVYGGIAGTLSSTGKFEGKLAHINIAGKIDTPDFEVRSGGHPMRLTSEFSAYVDATRGDTFLNRVTADFWKTHVVAKGSVAGSPGSKGKTALIDLNSTNARIEDLLKLFVQANRAPMSGSVTLQAKAELPPEEEPFLKKLKMSGAFGVDDGTFSDSSTQQDVDKLSAGARGEKNREDPETVLTALKGRVNLVGGKASFPDLSFGVPGAAARMHGTYGLITQKIDLHGHLRVDTKISNTTDGTKAFLPKVMNPFFKKKPKGEIVPVKISGTYEHPSFGLDVLDDKDSRKAPPH
ncbi:MAG: AsmA-like C-terminal region-containing protein [Candidatus Sulfotelmatobacter sp.]